MNGLQIGIVGAGWLGMAVARRLVSGGALVTATTTSPSKLQAFAEAGMQPLLLNLDQPGEDALQQLGEQDVLVYTLPPAGGQEASALRIRHTLRAALSGRTTSLIMISSTSVYPDQNAVVTEEDAVHNVSAHSGVDLLALEEEMQAAGLPVTILRMGGLYGPGRFPGRFLAGRQQVAGADVPVNMSHQDDAAGAVLHVLHDHPGTFNVVAPAHPGRREFYGEACRLAGLEPPSWSAETKAFKVVSSEKIIRETGFSFVHPDPIASLAALV